MLCEVNVWGNFWVSWAFLSVVGFVLIMLMSGILFYFYYQHPTYERWTRKSNPKFPTAETVRNEIIQMLKGMFAATLCPALSLYLAQHGYSKAYCGTGNGEYGLVYHVVSFVVLWIASDFWEFYYHRLGHVTDWGWVQHKYHHHFYNPSPFAVIADEYLDQFVRAAPLLLFPMIAPVNIDMMFFQFGLFFYGFGSYLHWGYEFDWPDAHHPIINTSFQHYIHHARSIKNKPYHTGFFFKLWDKMFSSEFTDQCVCAKCCRGRGERSREQWEAVRKEKPDYSVLVQPSFWLAALSSSKKE